MREYEVDNRANRNSRSLNEAEKKSRASRVQPWPIETQKMLIFIPNRRLQQPILTTEIKLNFFTVSAQMNFPWFPFPQERFFKSVIWTSGYLTVSTNNKLTLCLHWFIDVFIQEQVYRICIGCIISICVYIRALRLVCKHSYNGKGILIDIDL